ncbi:VOC family protein [Trebonia sp.]|uniref:VOC family protein n=1 Tax=Trebonia sp. TaxID=2767075 RepID=UPI003BAFAADF
MHSAPLSGAPLSGAPLSGAGLNRAELSAAVADAGWRLVLGDLCTQVATESLRQAADTAATLATLDSAVPAADGHGQLRLDIRPDRLVITLAGVLGEGRASPASAAAAWGISAWLRELGLPPEPARVQTAEIGIDALDIPAVLPFWRAVFGYADESPHAIVDPAGRGPAVWFQQMDAPRPQRNRIHIDVSVPHDQAQARLEATLAAGGRLLSDAAAPAFWVLADPEGNEACITTWQARD